MRDALPPLLRLLEVVRDGCAAACGVDHPAAGCGCDVIGEREEREERDRSTSATGEPGRRPGGTGPIDISNW